MPDDNRERRFLVFGHPVDEQTFERLLTMEWVSCGAVDLVGMTVSAPNGGPVTRHITAIRNVLPLTVAEQTLQLRYFFFANGEVFESDREHYLREGRRAGFLFDETYEPAPGDCWQPNAAVAGWKAGWVTGPDLSPAPPPGPWSDVFARERASREYDEKLAATIEGRGPKIEPKVEAKTFISAMREARRELSDPGTPACTPQLLATVFKTLEAVMGSMSVMMHEVATLSPEDLAEQGPAAVAVLREFTVDYARQVLELERKLSRTTLIHESEVAKTDSEQRS